MSFLSKVFKSKDGATAKPKNARDAGTVPHAPKPQWEDPWLRKDVQPEEVAELLHICSHEMKSRALNTPFLLLPFRPNADPSAARAFIRNFFKNGPEGPVAYAGERLHSEVRLVDPMVLCSIMKWCWSRLKGGVVGWTTYELFKTGESESQLDRHAFDTFIPLSVESAHRKNIIFDFFDLLSAIAANVKTNGLGGRKLSRLSGWWAFDHSEGGNGFDSGYKSWENAAHATSHLFFAYLRARMPDNTAGSSGISQLPRSLLALVSQTEYPPETPILLLTSTPKVVMVVERVSPTPYALLRRARHFAYPGTDDALQKYSDYDDPVRALTFECRRVLDCISSTNQSVTVNHETSITSPGDTSWSRFEDLGFSSLLDEKRAKEADGRGYSSAENVRSTNDLGRPTTPSWADFLSSGFADDASSRGPGSLLLPPEQILPPLNPQRVQSSQSHVRSGLQDDYLEPGELSYVNRIELDETFWWVWMTSLAGEETNARKAVFGRCALVETELKGAKWLVMEEQVRGAAVVPDTNAAVIQKRGKFGLSVRNRSRRSSLGKRPPVPNNHRTAIAASASTPALNRNKAAAEQKAKVQAAAAALIKQQTSEQEPEQTSPRRGRLQPTADSKTNSVMTLGLGSSLQNEAGPAMQWARKFDKETIRSRYLGDDLAGTGASRAPSPAGTMDLISATKAVPGVQDSTYDQAAGGNALLKTAIGSPPADTANTKPVSFASPTNASHGHKDSEKPIGSSVDVNNAHRKQTSGGSVEVTGPPASQEKTKPIATPSTAQPKSPAAAAAAAAAAMRTTQTQAAQNGSAAKSTPDALAKSKPGNTQKFKNLFNRKKPNENEEPEALAKHREINARKKRDNTTRDAANTPEPATVSAVATQPAAALPAPSAAPAVIASTTTAPAAPADEVLEEEMEAGGPGPTVETTEAHAIEPVTLGRDPPVGHLEDHTSLPVQELSTQSAAQASAADKILSPPTETHVEPMHDDHTAAKVSKAPVEEPELADDEFSASSVAPSTAAVASTGQPSQDHGDRWAQIRKNAVERKSEDVPESTPAQRMSQATEKIDDGETSGEETIEQRVARIRARVAQLTGNATGDPTAHME